jgi:hypothetical protein
MLPDFGTLVNGLVIAAIVLLTLLLTLKELLRAAGAQRFSRWALYIDIAVFPVLLIFGALVLVRIISSAAALDLSSF